MRTWWIVVMVLAFPGCDAPRTSAPRADVVPKTFLSEQYLRKERECERRPPFDRGTFPTLDYGEPAHDSSRAAEWKMQSVYLGETCLKANIGPLFYLDSNEIASYTVDVEARIPDSSAPGRSSSLVLFSRNFRPGELPPKFERTEIADVVSFDDATRTVHFKVGDKGYAYRLPAL